MNDKINCVLITVCSRTDEHGFQMLQKSTEKFDWPFVVLKSEWKGFGTKLISTYFYLKSDAANDITHFFFCDAYDVVVLSTMEEALSKINDKSKMLVGAERGLWPPEMHVHDHMFTHFDHGFNFVNSGLYFAPKELFLELFEQNKPEYSTDDQKWLTELYVGRESSEIALDNDCDVFQNYSFIRDGDYSYNYFHGRLINLKTKVERYKNEDMVPVLSEPVFVHGNGRTDMSSIYLFIDQNPKITDFNIATESIQKLNQQPWETHPSKKYCMDLASKIPYHTLDELIGNAEKIKKYLTEIL